MLGLALLSSGALYDLGRGLGRQGVSLVFVRRSQQGTWVIFCGADEVSCVVFGTRVCALPSLSNAGRLQDCACIGSTSRRYATSGSSITGCPEEDLVGVVDAASRCYKLMLLLIRILPQLLIRF